MLRLPLASLTLLLGLGVPAWAEAIPDGSYYCSYYSGATFMGLGYIEISGKSYRGPAFEGSFGGWYQYEMRPDGNITWFGPLGGLTSGGNTVVASTAHDGEIGIQVMTAADYPMVTTCS